MAQPMVVQPEDQLSTILEETTAALSTFDLDGLLGLLQRAEALRSAGCDAASAIPRSIVKKHELLGAMLHSTETNLNLLRRLNDRDARWPATEKIWER